ncbi:MAG: hypothetical protein ACXVCH_17310 [Bdellovibrionota bacterium]
MKFITLTFVTGFLAVSSAQAVTVYDGCIAGTCSGNSTTGCTGTVNNSCNSTSDSIAGDLISSILGTTFEQNQIKAGTMVNSGTKGYLTIVNSFLLGLGKSATGATATTGTTFVSGPNSIHYVITANPTVGGTAYDWEAKVWRCFGSATTCTAASMFNQALYMAWSVTSDGKTNKGVLAHGWINSGSSTLVGGMSVTWDVGSSTTTKTVQATMFDNSTGTPKAFRYDSTKVGTKYNITQLFANNSSATSRSSVTYDSSALSGAFYYESGSGCNTFFDTGCGAGSSPTIQGTAVSDTPTTWGCFTMAANAATQPDFTYTATGSQTGCTLSAVFPAVTVNSIATGITSVATATVVGSSSFNGMSANPPNI